ncbi:MAG: hypothetical protein M1269_12490 [Chloroflexi bacterium]|nr:hypothetical protein [Chloroflexota bacterium]
MPLVAAVIAGAAIMTVGSLVQTGIMAYQQGQAMNMQQQMMQQMMQQQGQQMQQFNQMMGAQTQSMNYQNMMMQQQIAGSMGGGGYQVPGYVGMGAGGK